MSTFAERLNLLRKEKKWTQDKLAELNLEGKKMKDELLT